MKNGSLIGVIGQSKIGPSRPANRVAGLLLASMLVLGSCGVLIISPIDSYGQKIGSKGRKGTKGNKATVSAGKTSQNDGAQPLFSSGVEALKSGDYRAPLITLIKPLKFAPPTPKLTTSGERHTSS